MHDLRRCMMDRVCIRSTWRGCCRCKRRLRPAPRPNGLPRHPDSESDAAELGSCRADQIGWVQRGTSTTSLLCRGTCSHPAASPLTPLMRHDAATSDTTGLGDEEGTLMVPLCRVHSNQYQVARQSDRCVVANCNNAWTHGAHGLKLCSVHTVDPSAMEAPTVVEPPSRRRSPAPSSGSARSPASGTPAAKAPPSPRKLGLCEVWLRAPSVHRSTYYRFLGERIKSEQAEYWRVQVPAIERVFDAHQRAHGPWDEAGWSMLTGTMKVPVLVAKWTGTRESLESRSCTNMEGDIMPSSLLRDYRFQTPVYHCLGNDIRATADSAEPGVSGSEQEPQVPAPQTVLPPPPFFGTMPTSRGGAKRQDEQSYLDVYCQEAARFSDDQSLVHNIADVWGRV